MESIGLIDACKVMGAGVAGGFVLVTISLLIAFTINRAYRLLRK